MKNGKNNGSKVIEQDGVKGSKYGDQTFISMEDMEAQVAEKRKEGYDESWNGCMRSGRCCAHFQIANLSEKYYKTLDKDVKALWLAHYDAKSIKDLPELSLGLNHTCSKLLARKNEDGSVETKCSIYENRPKICSTFVCGASKVRKKIMKELIENEK